MTLHYIGGKKSEITVTKEGKKYLYFTANDNRRKYRMNKETKEVQIAPYWDTEKRMTVTE